MRHKTDTAVEKNNGLDELIPMMKRLGHTPYVFLKRAAFWASQRDYRIAELLVNYAMQFENKFFDNEKEESAFQVINQTVLEFIQMLKSCGHCNGSVEREDESRAQAVSKTIFN